MPASVRRYGLVAGWIMSVGVAFELGSVLSTREGASDADSRPLNPQERSPEAIDTGASSDGGNSPPAPPPAPDVQRVAEVATSNVQTLELRIAELEARLAEVAAEQEDASQRWSEDRAELRKLRRANGYLVTELGPYRRTSISLRPAFLELHDPSGQYRSEALRSCLLDFVAAHPLELSDGEIVALAPVVTEWYGERSNLQEEDRRIDADKTLDDATRERLGAENRRKKYEGWQAFVAKLVEILGEERGSMFE